MSIFLSLWSSFNQAILIYLCFLNLFQVSWSAVFLSILCYFFLNAVIKVSIIDFVQMFSADPFSYFYKSEIANNCCQIENIKKKCLVNNFKPEKCALFQ